MVDQISFPLFIKDYRSNDENAVDTEDIAWSIEYRFVAMQLKQFF